MYCVKYGAAKTKVTVTGPVVDQDYYKESKPWTMEGEKVQVVDNNEHLGQIIGVRQEERNVDLRVKKARNSLFSLLGPALAYKCLMSPAVKLHLFRTFTCPRLRSGLSTFSLRKNHLKPLELFQRKCLKSFYIYLKKQQHPQFIFSQVNYQLKEKYTEIFFPYFTVCGPTQTVKYLKLSNICFKHHLLTAEHGLST